MDAITLLKQDHKTVKGLFAQFDKAGDSAYQRKRELVDKIIEELSIHAAIEEQLFYPAARQAVEEAEDNVLESLEEHHVVKWILSELEGMDPKAERFTAKVTVLKENVLHHAEEEETDLFPKVRGAVGRKALQELGDQMEKAKKIVPSRPHPKAPDTPPANLVAGPTAGLADKARAAIRGRGKSTGPKSRAS
ncbi:MAG: hemerythrin domain-containing protein [Actinobacteria bacterium]|nr:hemerythrin domain-containing protein [Actinomycetota bacterium]